MSRCDERCNLCEVEKDRQRCYVQLERQQAAAYDAQWKASLRGFLAVLGWCAFFLLLLVVLCGCSAQQVHNQFAIAPCEAYPKGAIQSIDGYSFSLLSDKTLGPGLYQRKADGSTTVVWSKYASSVNVAATESVVSAIVKAVVTAITVP